MIPFDDRRFLALPGDYDASLSYAVSHFLEQAERAIRERGQFFVALSGGSTPKAIYEKLKTAKLEWTKVKFFFSDERCVPLDDPDSNYRMAMQAGIQELAAPGNVFPFYTDPDPQVSADRYEELLKTLPPSTS